MAPRRILYTGIFFTAGVTALIFIFNGALELQEYDFDGTLVAEHPTTDSYARYLKINATIDPFRNFIQDSPLTLVFSFGCMLVGVWMAQSSFLLDSSKFRTTMRWLIVLGIVFGFTCSYLFWLITRGDLELTPGLIWLPFLIVAGLFLQSLFYVSSFLTLYRLVWFRKLVGFLVPVGRMPLTNYVLQSVFYLFIFFHCTGGLNLYGQLNQSETYLLCIPLFLLQAVLSHFWLNKFSQGPLEYLWKRLTYGLFFRSA